MNTVHIFIPTYNPEPEHLRVAISCVLMQTFPHWTLTIRDDASDCDVEQIVRPFLNDKRVSFCRNEKNLGIGGNWNACLRGAKGDFVQFLFQDDLWEPTYLEECLAAFSQPSIDFVVANHRYAAEGGPDAAKRFAESDFPLIEEYREKKLEEGMHGGHEFLLRWLREGFDFNVIGEPSFVMLRRSVITTVGPFNESLQQYIDVEYWLRLMLAANFVYVRKELGAFRIHPGGASARNERQGIGVIERFKCLSWLAETLPSREERRLAGDVLGSQFSNMKTSFVRRMQERRKIRWSEFGYLGLFSLRHPQLALRILRALFS